MATYDKQPEMSAAEVTDKCVERIESGAYDVIILNFANCDMVGHTGVYDAAVKAVETVDSCVGRVVDATPVSYTHLGLPDGQMGNSEVGHTNIGAGRVVFQDLPRITKAIADGSFDENPAYRHAMDACLEKGTSLHLMLSLIHISSRMHFITARSATSVLP